ncbi:dipeptidase PepV [Clostridia bacterium]|nr:dipeptidase PepV [Clostridia bacterium]
MSHHEIIEELRDEAVRLLRGLVSYPSVKEPPEKDMPFGAAVQGAFEYLLREAAADGFEIFNADNYGGHIDWRGAVLDARGEVVAAADETLGIPIHLDVVPAGDGWTKDPWGGEEEDGRIYGRGTTDDKGPTVSAYLALKALKTSGYFPAKNVRLIIGLDEETGWSGMEEYFKRMAPPDFGFSPDANFPVINGEMGMMVFEIAKKLEPSQGKGLRLRSVKGGAAPNMVPDRCRAVLVFDDGEPASAKARGGAGRAAKGKAKGKVTKADAERAAAFERVRLAAEAFRERTGRSLTCRGAGKALEVSAQGVSAHGAHPEKGLNAISVLMEFLSELNLVNENAQSFIDFYRNHIDYELDGKRLGIAMEDEPSGSLIVNTGMIELGTEAAILTVNVRCPVTKSEDDVYDALRPALDKNGLGVVKVSGMAPLYFPPDDPFIQTLMAVYRKHTGDLEHGPLVMSGGTYARAIPNAVAFGPAFPDDEDVMHQKDEYIKLDNLMRAAHIYADAIQELTKG